MSRANNKGIIPHKILRRKVFFLFRIQKKNISIDIDHSFLLIFSISRNLNAPVDLLLNHMVKDFFFLLSLQHIENRCFSYSYREWLDFFIYKLYACTKQNFFIFFFKPKRRKRWDNRVHEKEMTIVL